jgi:predicted RNA-binding Zn-ribbon protein involved in translation (DUF1610 family)
MNDLSIELSCSACGRGITESDHSRHGCGALGNQGVFRVGRSDCARLGYLLASFRTRPVQPAPSRFSD